MGAKHKPAEQICDDDLRIAWKAAPFLEKVMAIVPSIIYVFNHSTLSNEFSNRSIGVALGYSIGEVRDMGADLFPSLCHPDDLPVVGSHFQTICGLEDGEVVELEYRMRHKNGQWIWLLSYDSVFDRDADGKVLRHIGTATDITKQKHDEQVAIQEKLAADNANHELKSFAYSLSHDLKSPSNTIMLLLNEVLEMQGQSLDEDALQLLEMGVKTAERMGALIEDVLRYTQLIEKPNEFTTIDLNDLVRTVVDSLYANVKSCGASIKVENLPSVRGCEMQLGILFQNLIENGLKFQTEGVAPVLNISAGTRDKDGRYRIYVRDNGIGISKSNTEKIFDIFQRLYVKDEYEGTGLGLAICRRISSNHGDVITVNSELGQGAEFSFRLAAA